MKDKSLAMQCVSNIVKGHMTKVSYIPNIFNCEVAPIVILPAFLDVLNEFSDIPILQCSRSAGFGLLCLVLCHLSAILNFADLLHWYSRDACSLTCLFYSKMPFVSHRGGSRGVQPVQVHPFKFH